VKRNVDPTAQRIVHRSPMFVALPVVILAVLALNFVWEVIRANVSDAARAEWPLRFVLLERPATAALLGVFAGLFLARSQWAKANRPSIGYSITDIDGGFDARKLKWKVIVLNGGPGIAVVEQFKYEFQTTSLAKSVTISLKEMDRFLQRQGLNSGIDYFIREWGSGAVFPPVTKYSDETMICWFTTEALAKLDKFDVEVRFRDSLGDLHERTLTVIEKLPEPAARARLLLIGASPVLGAPTAP
jgi:hypothetical protein